MRAGIFAVVVLAGCGAPLPPEEQAARALEAHGANLDRDANLPGNPVIRVDLGESSIPDEELANLTRLPELRDVGLYNCPVTDAGVKHVAACPKLEVVKLGSTRITGAALPELAKLANLKTLNLSRTDVGDADLRALSAIPSIEQLDLRRTKITDNGLPELRSMTRLKVVNVAETAVTAEGAAQLQRSLPGARVLRQKGP